MKLFDGTRRGFLKAGLVTMASTMVTPAFAALPHLKSIRTLSLHNLHTDEKLHVDYWKNGTYDRGAIAKLDHIFRDHYSNDTFPMDVRVFDLLYDLQAKTGDHAPVEIISGYRSPHTNMMLARATDGVAKHSYHTKGMAMDIRMNRTPLPKVYKTALAMKRGGAGFYPDSQFVHIDVGPVRTW